MKKSVDTMIDEYIRDTGTAKRVYQGGRAGVIFLDEGEFIPLTDLGYNTNIGFYRISRFPDVKNEAETYADK